MPVDVEKLKRDLSEALTALAQGKGYLGIDALADDLEKLGTDYRYLAQAVRSAGKDAGGSLPRSARRSASSRRNRRAPGPSRTRRGDQQQAPAGEHSARVHHQAGVILGYPSARPLIFPETGVDTPRSISRGFNRMATGCWCRCWADASALYVVRVEGRGHLVVLFLASPR